MSEFICLFGCSLTPPKRQIQASAEILRDDSPGDWEGFRLKTSGFAKVLAKNSRTENSMYYCILVTCLAVNFILSSMNLPCIWEMGGW